MYKYFAIILIVSGLIITPLVPFFALAQSPSSGLSMSVTPILFEMSASPSQVWNSSVKVINNNRHDLVVYAQPVNFAPQGETGQGKFIPVFEDFTGGTTLAEWIDISEEAFVIPRETSIKIPFTVRVPDDASPGGHFAAIMIGTKPPENDARFKVTTSQIVTSLFFVRVSGDVVEDGSVREFRTVQNVVQTPKVDFEVRFENKGNVHVQPQGEIRITNMWGKERGLIPINHQTHFGNVLPESIRKFEFTWKGEQEFTDIGRYTAKLSLAYGDEGRKFVTSTAYFWIVPVKPVLTVLGSLAFILFFITWAIKAYVRRMLSLSGYQYTRQEKRPLMREGDVLIQKKTSIRTPVKAGVDDLRDRLSKTKAFLDTLTALFAFVWNYKFFFGGAVVLVCIVSAVSYFFVTATEESRDYEVTIGNPNQNVTLSSEEILYEQTKQQNMVTPDSSSKPNMLSSENASTTEQVFELYIVNSSDTTGVAADLQRKLESVYKITSLKSDFGESKEKTVIVYNRKFQEQALVLSRELGGAPLSALPEDDAEESITIYIGNNYVSE